MNYLMLKPEVTIFLYRKRIAGLDEDIKKTRRLLQDISNCPHCVGIRKETNIQVLIGFLAILEKANSKFQDRIDRAEEKLEYTRGLTV